MAHTVNYNHSECCRYRPILIGVIYGVRPCLYSLFYLCIPETTDRFVRSVARCPLTFVVLEESREEQKESDRSVDDALVRDVNVRHLLVHRFVQCYHRHHVHVREEPERT